MPGTLQPISALQSLTSLKEASGPAFAPRSVRDAPKEFEAFVLQSFIQEMLPKKAEGVYGSGVAGDIWRSMLAEKLAFEVTERGGIGIAEEVRAGQIRKGASLPESAPAASTGSDNAVAPASAESGSTQWQTSVERS